MRAKNLFLVANETNGVIRVNVGPRIGRDTYRSNEPADSSIEDSEVAE